MQDDRLGEIPLGNQTVEEFGLLHGAGITIQKKPVLAVGLSDPFGKHRVDEIIAYQSAAGHDRFGGLTQSRSGLNLPAQHVAG